MQTSQKKPGALAPSTVVGFITSILPTLLSRSIVPSLAFKKARSDPMGPSASGAAGRNSSLSSEVEEEEALEDEPWVPIDGTLSSP
jgi:hypothetical protein